MTEAGTGQLPEFPVRLWNDRLAIPACVLRPAAFNDLPFLRRLYHSFRKDELAHIPWPQEHKDAFLNQQFDLQHRYYIAAFPQTDFLIIEKDGTPIGRLYIQMAAHNWHIIDIGFLPEWRNRGMGSAMLSSIQDAAIAGNAGGIVLHVDQNNRRARGLYEALGFKAADTSDTHIRMEWLSPQHPSEPTDVSSAVN
ncbi:GNAT family N-acetyltransferase [Phyllobacterium sp. OV277]|uniref:GNAT family N-acetyltransferase n=1 Tax=Phyllobacterium sp. OV277 TaxID=1882772 RepID=UPI00088570F2|nr:GNAT family N-acetyltransferase [Phyllobacterium sp. OV277]SDP33603.1 Ribosomal protein S18 acetylase RimI [Phyllobacterium sp. OV277]